MFCVILILNRNSKSCPLTQTVNHSRDIVYNLLSLCILSIWVHLKLADLFLLPPSSDYTPISFLSSAKAACNMFRTVDFKATILNIFLGHFIGEIWFFKTTEKNIIEYTEQHHQLVGG